MLLLIQKCENEPPTEYNIGDVYNPTSDRPVDKASTPELRVPLSPQPYIVMETPFIQNMRLDILFFVLL